MVRGDMSKSCKAGEEREIEVGRVLKHLDQSACTGPDQPVAGPAAAPSLHELTHFAEFLSLLVSTRNIAGPWGSLLNE